MRLSFLLPFVIVIGLVELYFSQQSNNIDIVISVNENPYTLTFDSNKFTLLGLAESFCRGKASELGITTLDALLLNCIPPVSNALRVQISRKLDPSLIRQGELSAESRQYVEQSSATEAVASRGSEVVSAAQQTPSATLPTNFEVTVSSAGKAYSIIIDLNDFGLMSTAESFCLQKAEELKIKTNEQLLFSCVPKVASIIKAELIKTYDPNAIPDGELSAASRRWLAQMQTQTTQTQQTSEVTAQGEQTQAMPDSTPKNAATAADSTASGNSYQVRIMANEKPYTITIDLTRFTVLSTAESFCRQKAADLGITTGQALVTRCIPVVADYIKQDLAKTYDINSIPEGALSGQSREWLVAAQAAQDRAAAEAKVRVEAEAAAKNIFEISVPIGESRYQVEFDRRATSPMGVAEALCDSPQLGLRSLNVLVYECIPKVASYIKAVVDREIAPASVPLGESSEAVRRAIASIQLAEASAGATSGL